MIRKMKLLAYIDEERANEKSDQGGRLFEHAEKVYSQTQRLFNKLKTEDNRATLPQIPPATIGVNYNFETWTANKAQQSTFYTPSVDLQSVLGNDFSESMYCALKEYDAQIESCKKELKESPNGHKGRQLEARLTALKQKKERAEKSLISQKEHNAKMMAQASQRSQAMAGLQAAVNASQESLEKAMKDMSFMKPVFKATGEREPTEGCFTEYYHAGTVLTEESSASAYSSNHSSNSTSQSSSSSNSSSSGGFWFWKWSSSSSSQKSSSDKSSHQSSSKHASSSSNTKTKSVKWCISFQAMYAKFQNELWDSMQEAFANPGWYIG